MSKSIKFTENKDIDITNGETDAGAGKKVKIKVAEARMLMQAAGVGRAFLITVISGYIVNDDTGKVLKFKDYHKSEIEFFFVEGKPRGEKSNSNLHCRRRKGYGKTSWMFCAENSNERITTSKEITVGRLRK